MQNNLTTHKTIIEFLDVDLLVLVTMMFRSAFIGNNGPGFCSLIIDHGDEK